MRARLQRGLDLEGARVTTLLGCLAGLALLIGMSWARWWLYEGPGRWWGIPRPDNVVWIQEWRRMRHK